MTIENTIYDHRGVDHEDTRRALSTIFNGDLGDFAAKQVKIAELHQQATLGSHYHKYRELFYLLSGEGTFTLMEINTGEKREYTMQRRDRLLIPAFVAHKATLSSGAILIGCTDEEYISPEHNDIKYDF